MSALVSTITQSFLLIILEVIGLSTIMMTLSIVILVYLISIMAIGGQTLMMIIGGVSLIHIREYAPLQSLCFWLGVAFVLVGLVAWLHLIQWVVIFPNSLMVILFFSEKNSGHHIVLEPSTIKR
jgi:hypothetical protein